MARHKIAGKPEYRLALELTEAETAYAAEPTREKLRRIKTDWKKPIAHGGVVRAVCSLGSQSFKARSKENGNEYSEREESLG